MDFLVRLVQAHESFRKAELEALSSLERVKIDILDYRPGSPFCVIRIHPGRDSQEPLESAARSFISRSVMSKGIYQLWGQGTTYEELHEDIKARSSSLWKEFEHTPFKFTVDTFCGKRSTAEQREIIDSFRYLGFEGKISMKNPEAEFAVCEAWEEAEEYNHDTQTTKALERNGVIEKRKPKRLFFGRYLGGSRRHLIEKHDLKKRPYISTTSMDAELALLTATIALAAPGKIFYDPFVGTGGFMVAASELGALTLGSDIDGRSFRGKGQGLRSGVGANFQLYGLTGLFGDCFTSDLIHTPLRFQRSYSGKQNRWLDGIIADPPYGVREGLKVLGTRHNKMSKVKNDPCDDESGVESPDPLRQPYYIDGIPAHTLPDYIPPKKPYSFVRMLDDILDFAARTLVDGGRLAFWMPSANELDQELALPEHPLLTLEHVCIQVFNKWSRRLLVFERVAGDLGAEHLVGENGIEKLQIGYRANDLNPFRKMYFKGFQND